MNPIKQLEAVLCDPDGKCCIDGSDADRAIVDAALAELKLLQGLLDQPEDDGSDWFYKLKFICRVLDGASPDKTDMRTALGMARSLFEEKHAAGMALLSPAPFTPITADDVTDEMLYTADVPYQQAVYISKAQFAECVNAYMGAKK